MIITEKDLENFINAIVTMRAEASDATASKTPAVYQTLKGEGALIQAHTKINWNGVVKIAAVDLWDTPECTPDVAPTLWEDLEYREGIRIIPAVITVAKAFHLNELGWWGDDVYKSKQETNVYTPEQYAPYWELQPRPTAE